MFRAKAIGNEAEIESYLNRMYEDEWELIHVLTVGDAGKALFIHFKQV